jgi:glutathione S-transferase
MESHYSIFGSPISLFTRKLEAAMQFYGAPFTFERKRDDNREEIERRAGTHQIPVLQTPENWMLADTTPILTLMDTRFPTRRLFPPGALGVLVHVVEEVLDEWVARTMVHYRWHYDENTCAVASKLVGRELSIEQARRLPLAEWGLRACRATGTEAKFQQDAAEKEYLGILSALRAQLDVTAFSLGDRPSAVDKILIGSLRGHTNQDPVPDLSEFADVLEWDARAANFRGATGEWAPFPDSTPFAEYMLKLARDNYCPFVLGNAKALANDSKAFVVETYGEEVSYLCRPYPERSRRMITERIQQQLDPTERARVETWLTEIGLAECFLD